MGNRLGHEDRRIAPHLWQRFDRCNALPPAAIRQAPLHSRISHGAIYSTRDFWKSTSSGPKPSMYSQQVWIVSCNGCYSRLHKVLDELKKRGHDNLPNLGPWLLLRAFLFATAIAPRISQSLSSRVAE